MDTLGENASHSANSQSRVYTYKSNPHHMCVSHIGTIVSRETNLRQSGGVGANRVKKTASCERGLTRHDFFTRLHHTKIYASFLSNPINNTLKFYHLSLEDAKSQNFYLHVTHSSFSVVIGVILTAQGKTVVIATSRLLLFVYCCTSTFFSVPTHTRRPLL